MIDGDGDVNAGGGRRERGKMREEGETGSANAGGARGGRKGAKAERDGGVGKGKTQSGTRGTSEKWFGGGISGESVRGQEPRIRAKRGGTASQPNTPIVIYPHYIPHQSSQSTF